MGAISVRLRTVIGISGGAGRPASMYIVPPRLRIRLKLWLPPNVWFQGSQSTSTGGVSAVNGQIWARLCWFAHSIPCVLMTPLGIAVEPDVNRILATLSGPTFASASSTSPVARVFTSSSKLVAPWPWDSTSSAPPKSTADSTPPNGPSAAAYTSPGLIRAAMCLTLPKSWLISE